MLTWYDGRPLFVVFSRSILCFFYKLLSLNSLRDDSSSRTLDSLLLRVRRRPSSGVVFFTSSLRCSFSLCFAAADQNHFVSSSSSHSAPKQASSSSQNSFVTYRDEKKETSLDAVPVFSKGETVYRNASHKHKLLTGFPFPDDDCKTLGDIWESAFKKYPNRPLLERFDGRTYWTLREVRSSTRTEILSSFGQK